MWVVEDPAVIYVGVTLLSHLPYRYKIDSQPEFAVWLRKPKQGLCIILEGWDGEGDGREVQEGGDICIPVAHSC